MSSPATGADENLDPLNAINLAQDRTLNVSATLKIARLCTVGGAVALAVVGYFEAGIARLSMGIAAIFLIAGASLITRLQKQIFQIRILQSQVYLFHKDKAHQTCGSMDPHLTKAR